MLANWNAKLVFYLYGVVCVFVYFCCSFQKQENGSFPTNDHFNNNQNIAMSSEHAMDTAIGKNGIEEDIEDASTVEDALQSHLPREL